MAGLNLNGTGKPGISQVMSQQAFDIQSVPRYYTARQVAEAVHLSERKVYELAERGWGGAYTVPGVSQVRFAKPVIDRMIREINAAASATGS